MNIVKLFKDKHIIPNLTVRNIDETFNTDLIEMCGSIAVSVETLSDVSDIRNISILRRPSSDCRFVENIPIGVHSEQNTIKLINYCSELGIDVTFLGYKGTIHNTEYKQFPMTKKLFNTIKKTLRSFGADTLFVQQNKIFLNNLDISKELIVAKEGAFSYYIDAVEQKIGIDSYSDKMIDFNLNYDDIEERCIQPEFWSNLRERFQ